MPSYRNLVEEADLLLKKQRQKGADYKFREGLGEFPQHRSTRPLLYLTLITHPLFNYLEQDAQVFLTKMVISLQMQSL